MEKSALIWIILGVSGVGKSSIGEKLAQKVGIKFIDGDDLHPRENLLKMSKGIPLDDSDRMPWLKRINDVVFSLSHKNEVGIIVCSALKKAYRDIIREGNPKVRFLYLNADFEVILDRISKREGHFMKSQMLISQFQALEVPHNELDVVSVDANQSFEMVIDDALNAIGFKKD